LWGGGPAGLAAGIYCQRGALKTVLFEKGPPGGQIAISKEVENYPGVEGITGFDLAEKMLRHARSFGLRIIDEEVVEVIAGPHLHSVRLANGDWHEAAALILGAGGTVRKLGVPGETLVKEILADLVTQGRIKTIKFEGQAHIIGSIPILKNKRDRVLVQQQCTTNVFYPDILRMRCHIFGIFANLSKDTVKPRRFRAGI
jgi:hypothetical protein